MPFNLFKTIIHQGAVITNVKNGTCPLAAKYIGITSNYWLEHWWMARATKGDHAEEGCLNYNSVWRTIEEIRIYTGFRKHPKKGEPWDVLSNFVALKRDEEDGDGSELREAAITVYQDNYEGFYNKKRYVPPPEKPTIPPSGAGPSKVSSGKGTGSSSGTTTAKPNGTN